MKPTKEQVKQIKEIAVKMHEDSVKVKAQCSVCRLMSDIEINKETYEAKPEWIMGFCHSYKCRGEDRKFIIHWT